MAGQELGGDQVDLNFRSQRPPSRQGQLHAAGAAAHKNHPFAGADIALHGLPSRQKAADGLDRHPRLRLRLRHGPAIDGQQVEAERRAAPAVDPTALKVQGRGFVVDEPGAGEAAKPAQVDVQVLPFVPAGDMPRQHARIGAVDLPGQDGQTDAGQGRHAKRLKHLHMAVAAANEQQIANRRRFQALHRPAPGARGAAAVQSGA